MTRERKSSILTAFATRCEGVSKSVIAPLRENPSYINITVFRNSNIFVACPYRDSESGKCKSVSKITDQSPCIQYTAGQSQITNEKTLPQKIHTSVTPADITEITETELEAYRKSDVNLDITLGQVIKQWLLARKMKQADLIRISGIDKSTVSRIVNDQQKDVDPKKYLRLAHSLGITTAYFQLRILPDSNKETE